MKIITRAALAAALVASVAVGTALPAQAAAPASTRSAHATASARIALPAPTVDPSVPTSSRFTVHVTQRAVCAGTAKCVAFSGTAEPNQAVVVRYELAPGAKRKDILSSGPATAFFTTADAQGRWSATADIYSPRVTPDRRSATGKSVQYRVIMSDDVLGLKKTGQYLGYVPVR